MPRCAGLTRFNDQCTHSVAEGERYCWLHDPANAERRSRAASKAGRSRSGGEIAQAKQRLKELADKVAAGEMEPGRASVCGQLLGALAKFIALERKIKVEEEFDLRLTELERRQGRY